MNAKRISIILIVIAVISVVGISAVYAQNGNGNGNGNGYGNGYGAQNGFGYRNGQSYGNGNGNGAQWNQQPNCGNNCVNGQGMGNGAQNGYGNGNGGTMGNGLHLNLPAAVVSELPEPVVALMIDGWLDEQHAYAVYGAVIEQLGSVRPFTNIQRSEAQHISAWETLFERYDIAIPEVPAFDMPTFTTLSEACSIGVTAETLNYDLYDTMIDTFAPYPDLLHVAEALRDASEFNHLPTFEACAGS